jgi:hypothetical protein
VSTDVLTRRWELTSTANAALKAAAQFWFLVAVTGQLVFAGYVAVFYGRAVAQGNFAAWNDVMPHGHIPGDTMGNLAVALHLVLAVMVIVGGALQLVPRIRHRAPAVHRWTGRIYILAAFAISLGGLYMVWVRGSVGDTSQHIAISLNAVLIMLCAAFALRHALARNFGAHRRWALRLFLVMSGVWFFRVGLMLWLLLNGGPAGFDPETFVGPFLTFLAFAQYLLPLAVLELYLRTQARAGAPGRLAVAAGLFVLTVAMGVGIFVATVGMWLPRI